VSVFSEFEFFELELRAMVPQAGVHSRRKRWPSGVTRVQSRIFHGHKKSEGLLNGHALARPRARLNIQVTPGLV